MLSLVLFLPHNDISFQLVYLCFRLELFCGLNATMALFRCENILDFAIVALSFVCGKYCPIMD